MYAIDVRTPLTYKNRRAASLGRAAHPRSPIPAMKSEIVLFDQMLANVRRETARAGSARRPAHPYEVNALTVKRLRGWTRLSQADFARPDRPAFITTSSALARARANRLLASVSDVSW